MKIYKIFKKSATEHATAATAIFFSQIACGCSAVGGGTTELQPQPFYFRESRRAAATRNGTWERPAPLHMPRCMVPGAWRPLPALGRVAPGDFRMGGSSMCAHATAWAGGPGVIEDGAKGGGANLGLRAMLAETPAVAVAVAVAAAAAGVVPRAATRRRLRPAGCGSRTGSARWRTRVTTAASSASVGAPAPSAPPCTSRRWVTTGP